MVQLRLGFFLFLNFFFLQYKQVFALYILRSPRDKGNLDDILLLILMPTTNTNAGYCFLGFRRLENMRQNHQNERKHSMGLLGKLLRQT